MIMKGYNDIEIRKEVDRFGLPIWRAYWIETDNVVQVRVSKDYTHSLFDTEYRGFKSYVKRLAGQGDLFSM